MKRISLSKIAGDGGIFTDGDWVESKDQDKDGDVRLIQLADVADGSFKNKSKRFLTSETANRLRCTFLKKDDILIARMPDPIGRACLFPNMPGQYATVVDVSILRTDRSIADPAYVSHMINTVEFRNLIQQHVKGSTRTRISRGNLGSLEIPLPPLEEQKRIAGILDQADALRRLRTRALEKLNTLGQAVFQEMFGKSLPSDDFVSLKDLTSKIGSGATPKGGDSAYKEDGIPLIRSMNVRNGYFDKKGLAFIDEWQAKLLSNVVVQANDVLLNITGASVARVARAPNQMDGARVNQHVAIIRPDKGILPEFLEAYLLMPNVKSELLRIAEAGATRQAITKAQIQAFAVPKIDMANQKQFLKRKDEISAQERSVEMQLDKLATLFASLQSAAFQCKL